MKTNRIRSLLTTLLLALLLSVSTICPVRAEITPTIIYSTIEGGSVTVTLKDAIYPLTEASSRIWYLDGAPLTVDGTVYQDASKDNQAILKLATTSTANHMQNYAVSDTTSPTPAGELVRDQVARLYVISRENYNNATLTARPVELPVGSTLYASELTLYVDSTPYPNFQPLRFLIGAEVKDQITVEAGTKNYTLTDTICGRTLSVEIIGRDDSESPKITSLSVMDNKADKYAVKKKIRVTATDNNGLSEDAYYWEENQNLAKIIKEYVMDGKMASDLEGLSWSNVDTHEVVSNGIYTVFVKDIAGNISYKDITISKISNSSPIISSLLLGKDEDGDVYIEVKASDTGNQPLFYKINKGEYKESSRLYDVKDGINTIYVKNEAGVEVNAAKEVYLDVYKNEVSQFSSEMLYNFIQVNPATWTNKSVQVSIVLPDYLTPKLAASPYSVNGGAFTSSRSYTVTNKDETVQFTIKDIYGNTHTSKAYKVSNMDKDEPSLEVSSSDGFITVKAQDSGSGISKIVVSSTNATNFVIKANNSYGVTSDKGYYKAPANGSYQFTVYDFAGNSAKASCQISAYVDEKTVQTALKNSKTDNHSDRSGATTGGASGSSTLGSKAYESSGTHVSTKKEDRGYSSFSTAGNSKRGELPEAKMIEVVKADASLDSAPVMKIEEVVMETTNQDLLKKLFFIVLPILIVGSLAVVVILNTGKKKK